MLGIIGAMDVEVNGIIEKMENPEKRTISNITFTKGTITILLPKRKFASITSPLRLASQATSPRVEALGGLQKYFYNK